MLVRAGARARARVATGALARVAASRAVAALAPAAPLASSSSPSSWSSSSRSLASSAAAGAPTSGSAAAGSPPLSSGTVRRVDAFARRARASEHAGAAGEREPLGLGIEVTEGAKGADAPSLPLVFDDADLEDLAERHAFYEGDEHLDYGAFEDPLLPALAFDPGSLVFETRRTIGMKPYEQGGDNKVILRADINSLALDPVVAKYVREIMGSRYNWASQNLRLVSRRYPTVAENKRHVVEMLQTAVLAASAMRDAHGDFEQRGPFQRQSGYRQKRLRKLRGRKPELPF